MIIKNIYSSIEYGEIINKQKCLKKSVFKLSHRTSYLFLENKMISFNIFEESKISLLLSIEDLYYILDKVNIKYKRVKRNAVQQILSLKLTKNEKNSIISK
jgi:hypothetical protein